MTTEQQVAANRENALKSTGPRTEAGKAVAKRNALKYGVYSNDLILRHGLIREDPDQFEQLHQSLVDDLNPEGAMESILVEKIAVSLWRLRRVLRAELGSFKKAIDMEKNAFRSPPPPDTEFVDPDEPIELESVAEIVTRQITLSEMPYDQAVKEPEFGEYLDDKYPGQSLDDLSEHQVKRLKAGFRKRVHDQARETAGVIAYQVKSLPGQQSVLVPDDRMSVQETRLERSIMRDLAALTKLQEMRGAK